MSLKAAQRFVELWGTADLDGNTGFGIDNIQILINAASRNAFVLVTSVKKKGYLI